MHAEQAQQAQGWNLSEGRPFSASTAEHVIER